MAVRGPQRPPGGVAQPPPPTRTERAVPALAHALLAKGLVSTPQEATRVARTLIASLHKAGVPPSSAGTPEAALEADLKAFQQLAGLPTSGRLDGGTKKALDDGGPPPVAPRDGGGAGAAGGGTGAAGAGGAKEARPPEAPQPSGWSDFTGQPGMPQPGGGGTASQSGAPTQKTRTVETDQAKARVEYSTPEKHDELNKLMNSLARAGFPGAGKGAAKLKDSLTKFQSAAQLPKTGKLDQPTASQLVARGLLEGDPARFAEPPPRAAPPPAATTSQTPPSQTEARAPPAESRAAPPEARTDRPDARADPTTRGLAESAGDPTAATGRGHDAPGASSRATAGEGGEGTAAAAQADDRGGSVDAGEGDPLGEVDDDHNAPSGDDVEEDRRRGHARLDDGSEADEGYYEIPPLSFQIAAALEKIARDDDRTGAPTYGWDVTLFTPGVFGARQGAPALLHLVVERAGPFDEVWTDARAALNEKLDRLEPDNEPLRDEDFQLALRRARARDV